MQDLADPCAEFFVEAYFNDPQVQKAIHANTALKYPWTRCRYIIHAWVIYARMLSTTDAREWVPIDNNLNFLSVSSEPGPTT